MSVALHQGVALARFDISLPADVHRIDTAALAELGHRPDATEGVTVFFERRTPRFTSRVSTDMPSVYPWWD